MAREYILAGGKRCLAFRSAGDTPEADDDVALVKVSCFGPNGGTKLSTNVTIAELTELHQRIEEIINA